VPYMPLTTRTFWWSVPGFQRKFGKPKWNNIGQYVPDVDPEFEFAELEWRSRYYEDIGVTFLKYTNEHGGMQIQYSENTKMRINVKKIRDKENTKFKFIYETPIGNLEQDSGLYSNYTIASKKPLLNSLNDYKIFKYIIENQIPENSLKYYFDFSKNCLKAIGDRGIAFGTGPIPPLMVWIFTVLMVEGVIFGIKDNKKELDELVEAAHKVNLKWLDIIVKSDFKVIIADAVNGVLTINPQIFDEYWLPYHQSYAEVLKRNNKLYVSHASSEPVGPILDSLEKTGLNALYGFVFPSNPGDPEIGEVCRRWASKKMVVMGGISPHFLATSTPDKIKEWVKRAMDNVGDAGNFILGTADDTVFGTPMKNIAAIPEALDEIYG
jgi:uroporphyrinogen-III decarboxylase